MKMRLRFLFFAALLCLLHGPAWSQQLSQPGADLKVILSATRERSVFTASVRNVSHRGLSVVMGLRCGDSKWLRSVRYRLTNEFVVTIDFDDMTGTEPCETPGLLIVNLTPGGSYTWNMHLADTNLAGDKALLRAATSGNHAYMLQAVLKAGSGDGPLEKSAKYPLWRGSAISNMVPFFPSAVGTPKQ
jgi:hypothetical protein